MHPIFDAIFAGIAKAVAGRLTEKTLDAIQRRFQPKPTPRPRIKRKRRSTPRFYFDIRR